MRISKTPNVTPGSTPPSSRGSRGVVGRGSRDEHYIWTVLVPRLIHPAKVTLIRALIQAGEPQSVDDLIGLSELDGDPREIERHATDMVEAGTLEVVSIEAGDEVPRYSFACEERVNR